jgi:hypothetical protein
MPSEILIPEDESLSLLQRLELLRKQIGKIPMVLDDSVQPGPRYLDSRRFDINRFLEVFDRIKLLDGYVLDYFYHADEVGGYPVPFTRSENADASALLQKLNKYLTEHNPAPLEDDLPPVFRYPNLIKHLEFEKTGSGYFQFAVFSQVVRRFYLYWHALYGEIEFILSKSQLDPLRKAIAHRLRKIAHAHKRPISSDALSALNSVDLRPRVSITGDSAEVTIVVFTEWGGFFYDHTKIKWPSTIMGGRRTLIADYDCGRIF